MQTKNIQTIKKQKITAANTKVAKNRPSVKKQPSAIKKQLRSFAKWRVQMPRRRGLSKKTRQRLQYFLAWRHSRACKIANPDDKISHDYVASSLRQMRKTKQFNTTALKTLLCSGETTRDTAVGADFMAVPESIKKNTTKQLGWVNSTPVRSRLKLLSADYVAFLHWYQRVVCVRKTALWRTARLKKLQQWIQSHLRFHKSRAFFNEDSIYRALARVATAYSPEERLVRATKKKALRLISLEQYISPAEEKARVLRRVRFQNRKKLRRRRRLLLRRARQEKRARLARKRKREAETSKQTRPGPVTDLTIVMPPTEVKAVVTKKRWKPVHAILKRRKLAYKRARALKKRLRSPVYSNLLKTAFRKVVRCFFMSSGAVHFKNILPEASPKATRDKKITRLIIQRRFWSKSLATWPKEKVLQYWRKREELFRTRQQMGSNQRLYVRKPWKRKPLKKWWHKRVTHYRLSLQLRYKRIRKQKAFKRVRAQVIAKMPVLALVTERKRKIVAKKRRILKAAGTPIEKKPKTQRRKKPWKLSWRKRFLSRMPMTNTRASYQKNKCKRTPMFTRFFLSRSFSTMVQTAASLHGAPLDRSVFSDLKLTRKSWGQLKRALTQTLQGLKQKARKELRKYGRRITRRTHKKLLGQEQKQKRRYQPADAVQQRWLRKLFRHSRIFKRTAKRRTFLSRMRSTLLSRRRRALKRSQSRAVIPEHKSFLPFIYPYTPFNRYTAHYNRALFRNPSSTASARRAVITNPMYNKRASKQLTQIFAASRFCKNTLKFGSANTADSSTHPSLVLSQYVNVGDFPFGSSQSLVLKKTANAAFSEYAQLAARTNKNNKKWQRFLRLHLRASHPTRRNSARQKLHRAFNERNRKFTPPALITPSNLEYQNVRPYAKKTKEGLRNEIIRDAYIVSVTAPKVDDETDLNIRAANNMMFNAQKKYKTALFKKFVPWVDYNERKKKSPSETNKKVQYKRTAPWRSVTRWNKPYFTRTLKVQARFQNERGSSLPGYRPFRGSFYTPFYRVRSRVKAISLTTPVAKESQREEEILQESRWDRAERLHEARQNVVEHRNKAQKVIKYTAYLSRQEVFKRNLYVSEIDRVKSAATLLPTIFGNYRVARIFTNKLETMSSTAGRFSLLEQNSLKHGSVLCKDAMSERFLYSGSIKTTKLFAPQPCFPGRGRKRYTFEAFLRQHIAGVPPARLRFPRNKNAKKIVAEKLSRENKLLYFQHLPRFSKAVKSAKQQNRSAYSTRKQRQLIKAGNKTARIFEITGRAKTGLAALPFKICTKAMRKNKQTSRDPLATPLRAEAQGLLAAALRLRKVSRPIRDLRQAGFERRKHFAQEKPFWVTGTEAWLSRRAKRFSQYKITATTRYGKTPSGNWAIAENAIKVTRNAKSEPLALTAWGENIDNRRIYFKRNQQYKLPNRSLQLDVMPSHVPCSTRVSVKPVRFGSFSIWGLRDTKRASWLQSKKLYKKIFKKKYLKTKKKKFSTKRKKYWNNRTANHETLRRILPARAAQKAAQRLEGARRATHARVVEKRAFSHVATPLHFRRPDINIVVSDADKKRWQEHREEVNRQRYRRIIEVSNSLTALFPQLISRLIEKNTNTRVFCQQTGRKVVRAIYWSLRIFLHRALETTPTAASQKQKALDLLKQELSVSANSRYFTFTSLREARYRLQPHPLVPLNSFHQGAGEWLRKYLPFFSNFYKENPEKYGHFSFLPIEFARARVSAKTASEWITQQNPGTMETKYGRLTSTRLAKTSTRFENMLMTTRRTPHIAGYGPAATLQVASPVNFARARTSFFRRSFSTRSGNFTPSLVTQLNRFDVIQRGIEQSSLVQTQTQLKARLLARSRLNERPTENSPMLGALDPRLVRSKSPRAMLYLQRLEHRKSGSLILKTPTFYNKTRHRWSTKIPQVFDQDTKSLNTTRGLIQPRRLPSVLVGYRSGAERKMFTTRRIFTKKKRATRRNVLVERTFLQNYARVFPETRLYSLKIKRAGHDLNTGRQSILHFRNADLRRAVEKYQTYPVLPFRALQIRKAVWNRWQRLKNKLKKPAWVKSDLTMLTIRKAGLRKKTPQAKTVKRRIRFHLFRNALSAISLKIKRRTRKAFVPRRFHLRVSLSKIAATRQNGHSKWKNRKKETVSIKQRRVPLISIAKSLQYKRRAISIIATNKESAAAQHMFNARRPSLWHDLTSLKMKKGRMVKNWLRDLKYDLKKQYYTRWAADDAAELEFFQPAATRLRKLIWQESDGKYWRPRLWKGFSF